MSNETFHFFGKELTENEDQLFKGFRIIDRLQSMNSFFEDEKVLDFFIYIDKYTDANFGNPQAHSIAQVFIDQHFDDVLLKLTRFFSNNCDNLIKDDKLSNVEKWKGDILRHSQSVLNFLIGYSRSFLLRIYNDGFLKDLASFVKSQSFVDRFLNDKALELVLMNLSLMRREVVSYKSAWIEVNLVDSLLNIALRNEKLRPMAYSIILCAATDQQISQILNLNEMMTFFVDFLNRAATDVDQFGNELKREKIEYRIEGKHEIKVLDIYCVPDQNNEIWDTANLMEILYQVSVNNLIKHDIFVTLNLKDPLIIFIIKGNELEKHYSLKLLAQLCFDERVARIVADDTELTDKIQELSVDERLLIKETSKTCEKILWLLSDQKQAYQSEAKKTSEEIQIFISYHWETWGYSCEIKNELERAGYKVRNDINEMHESSLDSIENAIESSQLILLCITEKYRQSLSCQLEAKYAMKCQKPIIPLIMQKGYENVGGWLGTITNEKICINFIKRDFYYAINKLIDQVALFMDKKSIPIKVVDDNVKITPELKLSLKDECIRNGLTFLNKSKDDQNKRLESEPNVVNRLIIISTDYESNEGERSSDQKLNISKENVPFEKKGNSKLNWFKSSKNVIDWSDSEVKNWFESKGIKNVYDKIKPCNGELLYELHEMQIKSPKLFYEYFSTEVKADRQSVIVFSKSLTELFKIPKTSKKLNYLLIFFFVIFGYAIVSFFK